VIYEAYRYAADGHAGELGDGEIVETGTLDECRAAVSVALESVGWRGGFASQRWDGDDDDVEAYHESDEEGCGGWAIRPAR